MPAVEDHDPLARAVLTQAHLKALVRHAGDDEADAGPRVEPLVHQPQLGRVRLHENSGERRAKPTSPGV
jgi:hypothetical protein